MGAPAMIKGVSGGPTTWPPTAVTALTTTPVSTARLCHWLHAEQIALQIPSMYAENLSEICWAVSQWYLFVEAAIKRAGGKGGGTADSSEGLKASWYCLAAGSPEGSFQSTGSWMAKERNCSFARFCITDAWGAGMLYSQRDVNDINQ